ncbi:MAG: mechanosensitive ion channel [Candidatus Rokuibacteriota bacterium]
MELTRFFESLQVSLGQTLPSLVGAVLILLVGWIVAIAVRAGIRRGLGLLRLNERLRLDTGRALDLESGIASGAYYLVLLLVLIAAFNTVRLELVSAPLQTLANQVFAFLPKLVAAALLLLAAWVLATIARAAVTRVLGATTLDERLSAGAGMRPISESAGDVLYWLIILLFVPAVLGALDLQGLLGPVEAMIHEILAMLPNVLAAAIIVLAGWWVARIVRELVTNLLATTGLDPAVDRAGLRGTMTASRLVGLVVYILILVPALIGALQALEIQAITAPATGMLEQILVAVPNIFAAAIILTIAFVVARLGASLVTGLLGGLGFDGLPARLGLGGAFAGEPTPSQLVGRVIVFFVMLFALVEAAGRLGFGQISQLVSTFIRFGADVLLGTAIIVVGFWLSSLAHGAILRAQGDAARTVAGVVRFAILGLVVAMGLRAMGLANDIVNLAFGLTLGSVAAALALSFGLGGREAAGRQMEHWLSRLRGER